MKNVIAKSAVVSFALVLISAAALADVPEGNYPPGLFKVDKIECSGGTVSQALSAKMIGQVTNNLFIRDGRYHGATVVEDAHSIVDVRVVSGAKNDSICDNNGVETMLVVFYKKVDSSK